MRVAYFAFPRWLITVLFVIACLPAGGEVPAASVTEKKWYERFSLRGYAQLRHNRLGETNPSLVSDQGDKSIGDKNAIFLRRARLIFSGDAGDHVSFYVQPDFASSPAAGALNFAQVRDWYADVFIDGQKEFRVRLGQSKVPFGFENLQSSQNRLALDRADSVNSAVKDERDIGVFFYWAPSDVRKRFRHLVDSGLKGSGDYGVVGVGVYNGQTANRPEANNNLHAVARITYPLEVFGDQIVEAGVQGYTGLYTVTQGAGVTGPDTFTDRRVAVSFTLYPQPIGLQFEYVVGDGPQLNPAKTGIDTKSLHGGYVLLSYRWGNVIPFGRYQYYRGGRKHETNSPEQDVAEGELGIEWQIIPQLEVTALYSAVTRTSSKAPYAHESGRLGRLQAQWNF